MVLKVEIVKKYDQTSNLLYEFCQYLPSLRHQGREERANENGSR